MTMLSSLSSGLLCAFGQIYIYLSLSVAGTEAAGAAAIDVKLRKRMMNELEK